MPFPNLQWINTGKLYFSFLLRFYFATNERKKEKKNCPNLPEYFGANRKYLVGNLHHKLTGFLGETSVSD